MRHSSAALSLGTAQWGSAYGLTNRRGELNDADVAEVVSAALALHVTAVDTHRTANPAQGYGRAQARLRPWAKQFAITTKVFGGAAADLPVDGQLRDSLRQLRLDRVHACLVHDWYALSDAEARAVARSLQECRNRGLVDRVGVSAYDEHDVKRAASLFGRLGAVQVPVNVLDQRLRYSSVMAGLHDDGVEVQARSVFLQGLLLDLAAEASLTAHADVIRFHDTVRAVGVSPLDACLAFVMGVPWVDKVVVGVTSADELEEIGAAWAAPRAVLEWSALASADESLLDPRRWNR